MLVFLVSVGRYFRQYFVRVPSPACLSCFRNHNSVKAAVFINSLPEWQCCSNFHLIRLFSRQLNSRADEPFVFTQHFKTFNESRLISRSSDISRHWLLLKNARAGGGFLEIAHILTLILHRYLVGLLIDSGSCTVGCSINASWLSQVTFLKLPRLSWRSEKPSAPGIPFFTLS